MLGKIIKYDFRAMSKIMVPVYICMLAISVVLAFMIKINIQEGFIFAIFISLFTSIMSASVVITAIFVIKRFVDGLLKNEGYLSFALPVKTSTHILAKVINTLIWVSLEVLAIILSGLIMILILSSVKEIVEGFRNIIRIFGYVDFEFYRDLFNMLFMMGLELISVICYVYAGYAIAHLFEKHKTLIMIAFFIFVSTFKSIFVVPFLINSNNILLFTYTDAIISIIVYSLLTWYILDRKLNLE